MGDTTTRSLPPNPAGVRPLTDIESADLRQRVTPSQIPLPENCATCGGTGTFRWYALDARDEVYDYECSCTDQWVLARHLAFCGVLDRYQRLGWPDVALPSENPALRKVAEFLIGAESFRATGRGLLISGGRDSGQSLLAALVFKHLVATEGWVGRYLAINELTDRYRATWRDDTGDHRRAWTDWVLGVDILIVDDLNKELQDGQDFSNTVTVRAISEALNYRYAAALPTILVSKASAEGIAKSYPGAGIDRAFDQVHAPSAPSEVMAQVNARNLGDFGLGRPVVVR